jgi:hypothetical protein
MMVKNEADFIVQTLNSTKPFIDHWTIVDTGEPLGSTGVYGFLHLWAAFTDTKPPPVPNCFCTTRVQHRSAVVTGSTDNTAELIEETMKDMPGELFHDKFEDFSTSRNLVSGAEEESCRCSSTLSNPQFSA